MKSRKSEGRRPKSKEWSFFRLRPSADGFQPFIPFIIWLITIAILSGYPGNKIPKSPFLHLDKLVHSGVYLVLSILLCYAFYNKDVNKFNSFKTSALIILFGVSYGGFMEILQEYIFINRSGNWYDFFANAIGAILGAVLFPFVLKLLPFKR